MNILIVHAHHEPESFCSALCRQAVESLQEQGHTVSVSDLHEMEFDPVSDRRNFRSTKNPNYLKQQSEEVFASKHDGFVEELHIEMQKLEDADAVIFSFPLWWFSMPAIMKGWCDRVLAAGRIYGGGKLYENGVGNSQKRGLILMTTGGGPAAYDGWGVNPAMERILAPIQHGIFWFNGILPLEPFIAWSPARIGDGERNQLLRALRVRLKSLFDEPAIQLPRLEDFPGFGTDVQHRFMVTIEMARPRDEDFVKRIPEEVELLNRLRRDGKLLESMMSPAGAKDWRAFLLFRGRNEKEIEACLQQLPLSNYFAFTISQLDRPSDG